MFVTVFLVYVCLTYASSQAVARCSAPTCTTCTSFHAECNVGFRDTFPNVTGVRHGGSYSYIKVTGNINITELPSNAFSGNAVGTFTLTKTSISTLSCSSLEGLGGVTVAKLKNNKLRSVPVCALGIQTLKDNLHSLYLNYNQIRSLKVGDFNKTTQLTELYLDHNLIERIPPFVFGKLSRLSSLHLHSNKLTSLDGDVFYGLRNLYELSLSDNQISFINSNVFNSFRSLDYLYLDGNDIHVVNKDWFTQLRYLQGLQLNNNSISYLPYRVFGSMCALERLNLSHNALTNLEINWFNESCPMKPRYLDLSSNQIADIPPETFKNLQGLNILYLRDNKLTMLRNNAFKGLTRLSYLYISGNLISKIEVLAFDDLSVVYTLDMSRNRLSELKTFSFSDLQGLRTLDLSGNRIWQIGHSVFSGIDFLRKLDLSENQLTTDSCGELSVALRSIQRLETVDLSGNPIIYIRGGIFEYSPNLRTIKLSKCSLNDFPFYHFTNLTHLRYLDLSNNGVFGKSLLVIQTDQRNLEIDMSQNKLTHLDLQLTFRHSYYVYPTINASSNNLIEMSICFNHTASVVPKLYLDHNHLSGPISVDVSYSVNSLHISKLDLSNNDLRNLMTFPISIPPKLFSSTWDACVNQSIRIVNKNIAISFGTISLNSNGLKTLVPSTCLGIVDTLELKNNDISTFNIPSPNNSCLLESLSLNGNKLHAFPLRSLKETCSQLDIVDLRDNQIRNMNNISSGNWRPYTTVYTSGNPLECNCDSVWLRSSASENDFPDARCISPELTKGYKPFCFSASVCNNTINTEPPSMCADDDFVHVDNPSLVQDSDSLTVRWTANGPGFVDHFQIRNLEAQKEKSKEIVPWNQLSKRLAGLSFLHYKYEICIEAKGPRVTSKPACTILDIRNERQQQKQRNIALGVSLPIIAIATVIVVVVYCKKKQKAPGKEDIS